MSGKLNKINNTRFHQDKDYMLRSRKDLMKFILNSPKTMNKTKKGTEMYLLISNLNKQSIETLTQKQLNLIENAYELLMKLSGLPANNIKHDF